MRDNLRLPRQLNERYRLVAKVGEGGMAEVYRAEDTLLERTVAVKLLRGQHLGDSDFVARFQQEARSAAKVAHPNIVTVYDVGAAGDANYIVMEFVEGESLKELIRRESPLAIGRTADIGAQILAALSFAHQKGLVHRDVKPQNILVGADGLVKVTDFGIARAADDPRHTAVGVVLATAQYCSPEQASGKTANAAADIYSTGVVLYEMLTGQLPFEADNPLAVALMHLQATPRPPRELNPAVPPRLEAIVLRAMVKDPAGRFVSAGEMRKALQGYQSFGQEETTTFQAAGAPVGAPVIRAGSSGAAVAPRPAASRGSQPVGSRPPTPRDPRYATRRPAPRGGTDWLAIGLGLFVFIAVAAAVPLGLRLWTLYFERAPSPTATSVITPTALPAGAPKVEPTKSPTVSGQTKPMTTSVPRFIGLSFEQAQRVAAEAQLNVAIAGESPSINPPMIVLSQAPTPDTPLPPGSVVNLIVSKGPEQTVVAPVLGDTIADARRKLEALGFALDVTEEADPRAAAGRVIAQWPDGGQLAPKGSIVLLTVSKGPDLQLTPTAQPTATQTQSTAPTPKPSSTVRPPEGDYAWVPDVATLPEAEARRRVDLAGLQNGFTNYQSETDVAPAMRDFYRSVAPGSVLSILPNAGERVQKGTTVKLAVKKP